MLRSSLPAVKEGQSTTMRKTCKLILFCVRDFTIWLHLNDLPMPTSLERLFGKPTQESSEVHHVRAWECGIDGPYVSAPVGHRPGKSCGTECSIKSWAGIHQLETSPVAQHAPLDHLALPVGLQYSKVDVVMLFCWKSHSKSYTINWSPPMTVQTNLERQKQ